MPCWLDHVDARTPLVRMPRQVGRLKPSMQSSILASILASFMPLASGWKERGPESSGPSHFEVGRAGDLTRSLATRKEHDALSVALL
jgi:hypothetical protein